MKDVKLAIIYYSSTGTNYKLSKAAEEAAKDLGVKEIKFLRVEETVPEEIMKTNEDWINLAISNPMEILLDHAHCERKAAGVALQLMFRYVSEPGLSEVLSPLAREELEHFERVLSILNARGKKLQKNQACLSLCNFLPKN